MTNMLTDDDRLLAMTYVDGELSPDDTLAFEARAAREPALAAAVARERSLRTRLQGAFDPVLAEPMPTSLLSLLDEAPHVAANDPLPAGRNDVHRAALPHARRWRWPEWGAMAACLALGIALGARVLAPAGSTTLALEGNALTAQGALREALEQRTGGGGDKTADAVAVGLSFRDHAQSYCRTFTLAGDAAGIACKQDGAWRVAQLGHEAASAPAAGGYRMAASPFSPALLQAVDAMRDGDTLDAAAEAAAKAKGWRP